MGHRTRLETLLTATRTGGRASVFPTSAPRTLPRFLIPLTTIGMTILAINALLRGDPGLSTLGYPALFMIGLTLGAMPRGLGRRPGVTIFFVIAIVRYVGLPLILFFGPPSQNSLIGNDLTWALFLYEEIIVLVCLRLASPARGTSTRVEQANQGHSHNGLFWAVVVLSLLALLATPAALDQYNFVFSSEEIVRSGNPEVSGAIALLIGWGRRLLPALIVATVVQRGALDGVPGRYFVSAVVIATSMMFFSGSSRQSALIPGIAGLFLLLRAFPKYRVPTTAGFSLALVLITSRMTTAKFGGTFEESLSVRSFEAYFNGPSNLSTALSTVDKFGHMSSGQTVFNDFFQTVPLITVDPFATTVSYFNQTFYRHALWADQIMPFSGQSLFYLGWILLPLPAAAIALLVRHFDSLYADSADLVAAYLYGYFSTALGMAYMLNISILAHTLVMTVIPGLLLLAAQRYLDSRKRQHQPVMGAQCRAHGPITG